MRELILRKESKRYPGLFVRKYTRQVFYDNLWHEHPDLIESRGHVELEDGTVVIRPFTKIFNRFENNTDIDMDENCIAIGKVNGFMAAATWVEEVGQVVISTTGSLDSEFVTLAESYLGDRVKSFIKAESKMNPGTYIFEICDPSDPHIIEEEPGAYLIGFRAKKDTGQYFTSEGKEYTLDAVAKAMGVKRPDRFHRKFSGVVDMAKTCKHEGFVVYGLESQTALKIKSPYYLCKKLLARRKDVMKLDKSMVDEEFYDLIDYVQSLGVQFNSLDDQSRLKLMTDYLERGSK